MFDALFSGLFDGTNQTVISVWNFLLCMAVSLAVGLFLTFVYRYKTHCTRSFLLTLAILPAAVCVVIMMVNGNIGAGVAVVGAFGLVRFRSVPGTAKEIGAIFTTMAAGLITGMGYLAYAALFAAVIGLVWVLYQRMGLGRSGVADNDRILRVTIPEDLNYTDVFDDLLEKYTSAYTLTGVKTTNMGSLFKLTYQITLRDVTKEKSMIDDLRCRNGNLEITVSRQEGNSGEL